MIDADALIDEYIPSRIYIHYLTLFYDSYRRGVRMLYSLGFSDVFFGDIYNPQKTRRPTNVADALYSMPKKKWDKMARDIFGVSGEMLGLEEVLKKILETNTCSNLDSPVEVWIDEEGYYTILVFDQKE